MLRPQSIATSVATALVLTASVAAARAGDDPGKTTTNPEIAPKPAAISWEIEAGFSAVGGSEFNGAADTGDVAALDTDLSAVASVTTREGPLLRFGFEFQRFDFSRPPSTPIPFCLQSLAFVVGADFQFGTEWLARVDLKPGVYGGNNALRASDFDMPAEVGISYFVSADLQIVAGASVDANRKYPVIPAIGLRWKFAKDWVLNAIPPNPRLEYTLNQSVTLYAGADFKGDTYRVSDLPTHSHEEDKLKNGVVDYTQIRVGAGTTWSINAHFTLEVEAGFVPIHEFDFHRADARLRSNDVPPYAGIRLKAEF